jgi:hypothetical protein
MMSDLGFILISFKKCLDTAFQKHINNYDTKKIIFTVDGISYVGLSIATLLR